MSEKDKITWKNYIGSMADCKVDPNWLNVKGIDNILSIPKSLPPFFYHNIPVIYLLDYTTGKYIMMTNSSHTITGYKADFVKDGGVYFAMEKYHKDYLKIYSEQTFADRIKFIRSINPEEHSKYIFSHNFKLKSKSGEYKKLIQRCCFIKSDEKGNPLLSLGMIVNVDHFHKENSINEVVEKLGDSNEAGSPTLIKKQLYFLHDEDKLFSKREKEILLWIAEGLTSKQIANKLFISEHTVINHRRNMMEKTNSCRVSELLTFAIRNGII